jgi:hypothetical protein
MDRPTCKPNPNLTTQIVGCATKPGVVNCAVKPVVKIALDPCVQNHVAYTGTQDPYLQNMPRHDIGAAINYSAHMGGEHHDISACEIM